MLNVPHKVSKNKEQTKGGEKNMVTDYICQSGKLCGYIKSAPSTRKGPICFVNVIVTYFTIKVTNTQKNPFQNIVSFNKNPERLGIMIYALR